MKLAPALYYGTNMCSRKLIFLGRSHGPLHEGVRLHNVDQLNRQARIDAVDLVTLAYQRYTGIDCSSLTSEMFWIPCS